MTVEYFRPEDNQEEYVKKGMWAKVKETTGKVPFVLDALAMYYCALDTKTPFHVKFIVFAALAYFILPVDAIPDAIPGAGYSDDAGAIAAAISAIGSCITDEQRKQAEDWITEKK